MTAVQPREDRLTAGILMMALAVTGFTCIDASAKWLVLAGLPALQVVFVRYAVHFLIALGLYGVRDRSAFRSRAPLRQALRSAFFAGATICNFIALQTLPITLTTTIFFATPILVTLLAIPVLGERVGLRRILAVCSGFLGVLLVTRPWGAGWHPAMVYSLGALVCAACYFLMTRLLAGTESTATQQIWSSGLAAAVLLPFALQGWRWPEGVDWIAFLLIGGFGAGSHIAATEAHRWADASILAPVIYLQLFQAAFVGWVLFETLPTPWTLAGGTIIIGSGLYIWQRERVRRT